MAPKTDVIEQLRAHIAELEEEILIERANGDHWRDAYSKWVNTDESARRLIELQEQLAKAEQRVAEAFIEYMVDLKQQDFAFTGTTVIGIEKCETAIRSGEWRKFVKEV